MNRSPYEKKAREYSEEIGVYEFSVNAEFMEYWSLYEDGFFFIRHNLETGDETRELRIPWTGPDCVPEFLKNPVTGATRYNYMIG